VAGLRSAGGHHHMLTIVGNLSEARGSYGVCDHKVSMTSDLTIMLPHTQT